MKSTSHTTRLPVLDMTDSGSEKSLERFFLRPAFAAEAEQAASTLLADIRVRGVAAVLEASARLDGTVLTSQTLSIPADRLHQAARMVPAAVRAAIDDAHARVKSFASAGLRPDWSMPTPHGGFVGERFQALDRVGVYVPGGAAPLVSSVLMTVTLARVAGVSDIVVCTPCRDGTDPDAAMLYALWKAGATEVYRVGGIQAVGLMAYGVRGIAPVQKIVGPGGAYVTAAKRQVYGTVALDLVAGPSEIAVLADDSATPAWVAADLLSQIEHGTGHERALLVTSCALLAEAVSRLLPRQAASLSRATFLKSVLSRNVRLVVTESLSDGMALCNRFAPEHLELMVRRPRSWARRVRAAGAVFLGGWTPESAGDFVAGPSHVLPTGGTARMFSGLCVDDFRRRSSQICFTRRDLKRSMPTIETFGAIEGLDGHARSARLRFET